MSESQGPRGKYKTTNWAVYNKALKARGSLTVWLTRACSGSHCCRQAGPPTHLLGCGLQFCMSIKCLFDLALRQCLEVVESLLRLAGLDWKVPDFSTVCRRQ